MVNKEILEILIEPFFVLVLFVLVNSVDKSGAVAFATALFLSFFGKNSNG